jgi:hypothetical protein
VLGAPAGANLGNGTLNAQFRVQVAGGFPSYWLNDTNATPTTGGLVRLAGVGSGTFAYQINTATAADFSTAINALTIAPSGAVTLSTPLAVGSGGTGAGTAGAALTSLGAAPLASPVFTGSLQLNGPFVPLILNDTGVAVTAGGLQRLSGQNNGSFAWQVNTAAAGDFSSAFAPMIINGTGTGLVQMTNLTVTGTFTPPSDRRLKENILPWGVGLDTVLRLQPKTWEWNGKGSTPKGLTAYGLIADEVEAVLPELVGEYNDPDMAIKTLNSLALIPVLINAVKELAERVEFLERAR